MPFVLTFEPTTILLFLGYPGHFEMEKFGIILCKKTD